MAGSLGRINFPLLVYGAVIACIGRVLAVKYSAGDEIVASFAFLWALFWIVHIFGEVLMKARGLISMIVIGCLMLMIGYVESAGNVISAGIILGMGACLLVIGDRLWELRYSYWAFLYKYCFLPIILTAVLGTLIGLLCFD